MESTSTHEIRFGHDDTVSCHARHFRFRPATFGDHFDTAASIPYLELYGRAIPAFPRLSSSRGPGSH